MATPFVLTVEAVLRMLRSGRLRVPEFHRPFVWTGRQTIPLLESVLAGLPVGTITVYEDAADAGEIEIGPVRLDAPAEPLAFWIVDGAQRIGALAGIFLSEKKPATGLAYHLETGVVGEGDGPDWLPFDVLADVRELREWFDEQGAYAETHAAKALELRSSILDYPLVFVRLPAPPTDTAADLFVRLNTGGVPLSQVDLFHARNPAVARSEASPRAIADRLNTLGFGSLADELVLKSIRTVAGDEAAAPDAIVSSGSSTDTEKALTRAISWLRDEAGVSHLSVWRQHASLLPLIARFFHLNERPSPRARILLRRWLWRTMAAGSRLQATTALRWAIRGEDSIDASRLLTLVSARRRSAKIVQHVGQKLALTALAPRSFLSGDPFPLDDVLAEHGTAAFQLMGGVPIFAPPAEGPVEEAVRHALDAPAILGSHALDKDVLSALFAGDLSEFRQRRRDYLDARFSDVVAGLAEWGASDRPAIHELLVVDENA